MAIGLYFVCMNKKLKEHQKLHKTLFDFPIATLNNKKYYIIAVDVDNTGDNLEEVIQNHELAHLIREISEDYIEV